MKGAYTIGIEEEYFLVDAATKLVAAEGPEAFFAAVKKALGHQFSGEMLQSQLEVMTEPHHDLSTARTELRHLRSTVATIAAEHGLAILAAGTHPTAKAWECALQSPAERYDVVMHDLQMAGQRNMLCGLHVHVELPRWRGLRRGDVPDAALSAAVCRARDLLAVLETHVTDRSHGLPARRLRRAAAHRRAPELFRKTEEFEAYVAALTKAGVIDDASYVWWALRPSLQHPTLELRAPDCCTFVDDSIAIAALYRSLARRLVRATRGSTRR